MTGRRRASPRSATAAIASSAITRPRPGVCASRSASAPRSGETPRATARGTPVARERAQVSARRAPRELLTACSRRSSSAW
jgi:hypothetical protein